MLKTTGSILGPFGVLQKLRTFVWNFCSFEWALSVPFLYTISISGIGLSEAASYLYFENGQTYFTFA